MTTNLDVPWKNSLDKPTNPDYIKLATDYADAISVLYSTVEGNHVTKVVDIRYY